MLKMFLLAVVGGLGCGVGVIYLIESMDTKVRDVAMFETLGVDVLAVVPSIIDPQIAKRIWRKDVMVVFLAGVYFMCFTGVFVYEIYLR
jgi:MFS-type transporter involved in bile tolerance (Atg22 family)